MSLSPYLSQAQYYADELLGFLEEDEVEAAGILFDQHRYDPLVNIPPNDAKAVFAFLGKSPSLQGKQFAKLKSEERLMFWLRARYLALAAADALATAYTAECHLGSGYRKMRQAIAEAVHPYPQLPSKDDILWRKIR